MQLSKSISMDCEIRTQVSNATNVIMLHLGTELFKYI